MTLYEYSPPKSNKKATGIILILFSLAAGLFMFTILFPDILFKWAIQLIAVCSFVAVIFIISRYVAKSYVYAVERNDNGNLDLTVTEITNAGRTKITVCRIGIASIENAYLLRRSISEHSEKIKSIQGNAKKDGRKFFNYCPDVNPDEVCILLVEECEEKFLLKLSPDSTLWGYLKK